MWDTQYHEGVVLLVWSLLVLSDCYPFTPVKQTGPMIRRSVGVGLLFDMNAFLHKWVCYLVGHWRLCLWFSKLLTLKAMRIWGKKDEILNFHKIMVRPWFIGSWNILEFSGTSMAHLGLIKSWICMTLWSWPLTIQEIGILISLGLRKATHITSL